MTISLKAKNVFYTLQQFVECLDFQKDCGEEPRLFTTKPFILSWKDLICKSDGINVALDPEKNCLYLSIGRGRNKLALEEINQIVFRTLSQLGKSLLGIKLAENDNILFEAKFPKENLLRTLPLCLKVKVAGFLQGIPLAQYLQWNPGLSETSDYAKERLTMRNPHTGDLKAVASGRLGLSKKEMIRLAIQGHVTSLAFSSEDKEPTSSASSHLFDAEEISFLTSSISALESLEMGSLRSEYFKLLKFKNLRELIFRKPIESIHKRGIKELAIASPLIKNLEIHFLVSPLKLWEDLAGIDGVFLMRKCTYRSELIFLNVMILQIKTSMYKPLLNQAFGVPKAFGNRKVDGNAIADLPLVILNLH